MNPIRILAVDDSETFLRGMESVLRQEGDIQWMGKAYHGAQAVDRACAMQPDVVLIDLRLCWDERSRRPNEVDGVKTIRTLTGHCSNIHILAISGLWEQRWVVQAVNAGAKGCLPKEATPAQIATAIRLVAQGGVALTPEQLAWLRDSVDPLTRREKEVLALLAEGKSDAEIARQLGIATRTASKHVENLRDKLEARSRWEAVIEARRRGLIS